MKNMEDNNKNVSLIKNVKQDSLINEKKSKKSMEKIKENPFAKVYMRNMVFISCMVISFMMFSYAFIFPFLDEQFIQLDGKVLPNTYLNGVLIGNQDIQEISNSINGYVGEFKNKKITFTNINGSYEYNLSDIGFSFNSDEIIQELNNNTSFSNLVKRIILGDPRREYNLEIVENDKLTSFVEKIKNEVNVEPKNGVFLRDEQYNLSFVGYHYGFLLDEEKFIALLLNLFSDYEEVIELPGEVINFENFKLLEINKKIVEFSTDYNSGTAARKKNVELAIKKLNGTVLYPNDVFSYYKVVGPYNASNGYHYYYNMVGSGVCQVSSTLYNVQLLAGLKTVYRAPHGKKVWYVDGGLDATVYGSYTDYKFKNSFAYPLYISAYTKKNKLYISIWSNEKVNENRYYKLRSKKVGELSYKVYRDLYENNKLVKTEFINSTKYTSSY